MGQHRENGERQRVYQMIDLNPDDRGSIFARWYERDSLDFQQNDLHTPLISSNNNRGVQPERIPKTSPNMERGAA